MVYLIFVEDIALTEFSFLNNPLHPVRFQRSGTSPPLLCHAFAPTPFGSGFFVFADDACAALGFGRNAAKELKQQLARQWPGASWREDRGAIKSHADKIFSCTKMPLLLGGTKFQKAIWQGLLHIPRGRVCSYQALAHAFAGGSHKARATGSAVGRNPISFLIPCHRVLGANGKPHGYRWGLAVKNALLSAEQKAA